MENPKISIIVPYFNSHKYISKCINSILNQEFRNIELILVDDGSTDNSYELCTDFAKKDNRIILLQKENGGQGSARNMGLDIARGDFIGFVDSDDFIEPEMYSEMIEACLINQADLAICGYNYLNKENGKLRPLSAIYTDIVMSNKELMREYVCGNYITGGPCNKLYKRHLFRELRFPSIRMREDSYLMPYIFKHVNKAVYVGSNLYNQFFSEGSTERSYFTPLHLEAFQSVRSLEEVINESYPELIPHVVFKKPLLTIYLMRRIIKSHTLHLYKDVYFNLLSSLKEDIE